MIQKYGTSGFRNNAKLIFDISFRIGIGCAYLSHLTSKHIGIMITASHNPIEDNGVKIIDHTGSMICTEYENILENIVNLSHIEFGKFIDEYKPLIKQSKLIIGHDTRPSCLDIQNELIKCSKIFNTNCVTFGLVTTPQLHMLTVDENIDYYNDYIKKIFSKITTINYNCIVDCANGTAYNIMEKIQHERIKLSNTNNHDLLNHNCGAEYYSSNGCDEINNNINNNELFFSFDGDSDRMILFYKSNDKVHMIDGAKIATLYALYLKKFSNKYNIGFIGTGYTNSAGMKYAESINLHTCRTKTGIKYLHEKAKEYDIAIYFEPNGHGTILFNVDPDDLELIILKNMLNQYIGDGISNFIAVLYILQYISIDTLIDTYLDVKYKQVKIHVKDKSQVVTNNDETKVIEPIDVQILVDKYLVDKMISARWFIRPSGTENYLKLYVESDDVDSIVDDIVNLIKSKIE